MKNEAQNGAIIKDNDVGNTKPLPKITNLSSVDEVLKKIRIDVLARLFTTILALVKTEKLQGTEITLFNYELEIILELLKEAQK